MSGVQTRTTPSSPSTKRERLDQLRRVVTAHRKQIANLKLKEARQVAARLLVQWARKREQIIKNPGNRGGMVVNAHRRSKLIDVLRGRVPTERIIEMAAAMKKPTPSRGESVTSNPHIIPRIFRRHA